uniref:TDP43_N domain-containing protein n=1 Tax=Syphacia muris TaxID=451379 RepID=A0A0N5ANT1_9BILA
MSDADKLSYLLSFLGPPLELVKGYHETDENYSTVLLVSDSQYRGFSLYQLCQPSIGYREPNNPEVTKQVRNKADSNLEEEEPEMLAINAETNNGSKEISDIPKNVIKMGLFWTTLQERRRASTTQAAANEPDAISLSSTAPIKGFKSSGAGKLKSTNSTIV